MTSLNSRAQGTFSARDSATLMFRSMPAHGSFDERTNVAVVNVDTETRMYEADINHNNARKAVSFEMDRNAV